MHSKTILSLLASQAILSTTTNAHVVKRCTQVDNSTNLYRANAVKEAFTHSWTGYSKYAFGSDELLPVTNQPSNSRNGWGASIADALTTAILMEMQDVVDTQLKFISTVDFTMSHTSDAVSLFETTIRYLGGMLAGYDLLKGPFAHLACDPKLVDDLLTQAKSLADALKFAFNTPTGIPINDLTTLKPPKTGGEDTNDLATAGTLVLEWTRLSDLLGDATYGQLAQKGESYLLNPKQQVFPGLLGSNINVTDGNFVDSSGGWGGGDDSFYEYLIKMWVYDSKRFAQYKQRWIVAADSTIKYLSSPSKGLTFVAGYNGRQLSLNEGHLTCFIGGNFLLGGTVLNQSKYTNFGLKMTESCHATYAGTASHIGPEAFSWDPTNVPADQTAFFAKNGFYITNAGYDLRPEVIESYYHAYKLTGNQKYQDWVWDAFVAINKTCRTDSGFSSISNVNAVDGGQKTNLQESFWFAEVMKYTYLSFADSVVGVVPGAKQNWVFNTEAHPVKVVS